MTRQRIMLLPGGTGFLGRYVAGYFARQNWRVVVLSRRRQEKSNPLIDFQIWDGETLGTWADSFEGADAVVNLAGRTVNCRYTEWNQQQIYESRLKSTEAVGAAIAACARPPHVWINASSATIYRHALDRAMDESTGEIGSGFSVDVCEKWEEALRNAFTPPEVRKVAVRTAMVFAAGSGGVFDAFYRLVKRGLGGMLGRGNQFVSWVHAEDFARSLEWILAHPELEGPINIASPNPVPNAIFMKTFREVCRQPIGLPATAWMLEIGAFLLRTETELLLKSRRVVPQKLTDSGFTFRYPELREALEQITADADPTLTASRHL
jgi:uncharacterized protein (TIGR01777 family)